MDWLELAPSQNTNKKRTRESDWPSGPGGCVQTPVSGPQRVVHYCSPNHARRGWKSELALTTRVQRFTTIFYFVQTDKRTDIIHSYIETTSTFPFHWFLITKLHDWLIFIVSMICTSLYLYATWSNVGSIILRIKGKIRRSQPTWNNY